MLLSFIKNLVSRRDKNSTSVAPPTAACPIRLHIGGQAPHPDWKIVDIRPGPHVDYVGTCTSLSTFGDGTVAEIYASHVIEHLGYQSELATALHEFNRVLIAGGALRLSVPDLTALCALFLDPALGSDERFHVMRMMFGGQINQADFHHVGLNEEFLTSYLSQAGFIDIARVDNFGLFDEASGLIFKDRRISLTRRARKPLG